MNNIEFRAWLKDYKMMVKVQRINFDTRTIEVKIGEGDLYEFDFEEIKLIQYTGLKDKNSKKIFEGDLLKTTFDDTVISVKFKEGVFGYTYYGFYSLTSKKTENMIIIGNIHENPELLEELDE
jgi:uncharacterized phage protein (TIGR01671 family)